jgi:hypothetical protein
LPGHAHCCEEVDQAQSVILIKSAALRECIPLMRARLEERAGSAVYTRMCFGNELK